MFVSESRPIVLFSEASPTALTRFALRDVDDATRAAAASELRDLRTRF